MLHATSTSTSRALQELKEASRNREATGIELIPDESNVLQWRALIKVRVMMVGGRGRGARA